MKQACIRCVVQLSLNELQWKDDIGVDIHLEGPPVFVRACVLGQLQHCHLHRPSFPISIHQQLTFDRILSNCRNPSMFNEVIRGEHVKIELIQITSDYQGGKILARFDCPAHKFLFPRDKTVEDEDIEEADDQQILVLNHSRHYKCPPELSYTSSTLLLQATIRSPLHITFPDSSSSEESASDNQHLLTRSSLSRRSRSRSPGKSQASRQLFPLDARGKDSRGRSRSPARQPDVTSLNQSLSTQERLHSLLSSYVEGERGSGQEQTRSPYRVKFKPPKTRHKSAKEPSSPSHSKHSSYYTSPTRLRGPHDWPECPRRSPEPIEPISRTCSAPSSPRPHPHTPSSPSHRRHHKGATLPNQVPLDVLTGASRLERMDPVLCSPSKSVPDARPPFVVRHADDSLLSERNFCGKTLSPSDKFFYAEKHKGSGDDVCGSRSDRGERKVQMGAGGIAGGGSGKALSDGEVKNSRQLEQRSPCVSPTPKSTSPSPRQTALRGGGRCCTGHTHSPAPYKSLCGGRKEDVVNKYLGTPSGDTRRVLHDFGSLGQAIEEKIERLKRECCECLHSADSLGEDSLSEDMERLRASLQGERDAAMERSARLIPDNKSGSVRIGPRDYWSQRMSELTGKGHRVIFDETLKKIYNRLYTEASMTL